MNDVILNKKASIERCIRQTRRYYALESEQPFENDFIKQDAIAMNLQRAAELAIDIANHLIKTRKLGLPQDSKDSFALLQDAGMLESDLAARLKGMVGFGQQPLLLGYAEPTTGALFKARVGDNFVGIRHFFTPLAP